MKQLCSNCVDSSYKRLIIWNNKPTTNHLCLIVGNWFYVQCNWGIKKIRKKGGIKRLAKYEANNQYILISYWSP